MVRTLKGNASIPQRRVLLARIEELLVDLQGSVATMLRGQYVSMTTDGWTSHANESYISFTVVYVNDYWKMVTLALSCSKKQGSTMGEGLAASIEAMAETHGLTGHEVVDNTDCEPSMVKAGRILTEKSVLMHVHLSPDRVRHGAGLRRARREEVHGSSSCRGDSLHKVLTGCRATLGVVGYSRHHPFEGNSGRGDAVVPDAVDG